MAHPDNEYLANKNRSSPEMILLLIIRPAALRKDTIAALMRNVVGIVMVAVLDLLLLRVDQNCQVIQYGRL